MASKLLSVETKLVFVISGVVIRKSYTSSISYVLIFCKF